MPPSTRAMLVTANVQPYIYLYAQPPLPPPSLSLPHSITLSLTLPRRPSLMILAPALTLSSLLTLSLTLCPPTLNADNPVGSGGLAGAGWHDPAIATPHRCRMKALVRKRK